MRLGNIANTNDFGSHKLLVITQQSYYSNRGNT